MAQSPSVNSLDTCHMSPAGGLTSKLQTWEQYLINDFDKDFILNGIKFGFNIVDNDVTPLPAECDNYLSATDPSVKDKVESQILTEIENDHYTVVDKRPLVVSALGAIPKKDCDDIRLIHDCSRPPGLSINDLATKYSVKYQTIDEAVTLSSPGCFYSKIDLKSAYRSVRIHPDNHKLTGLKWWFKGDEKPSYLIDKCLPFGARKSPAIFHRLTQAVRRIMADKGFSNIIVYLDDFLIVEKSKDNCLQTMNVLIELLRSLGFMINWNKVIDPVQQIVFLGIQFDSVIMNISFPNDKLLETMELLRDFQARTRASKKQLQRLAGKLNWASRVIRGGRTYLRRVLNLQNSVKNPYHKVKLSTEFLKDIQWWLSFMSHFNGKPMVSKPTRGEVYVDACNLAAGIAYQGDWAYALWAQDWPEVAPLHINFKEVLSVVLAARRWGHLWANSKIIIYTDSDCAKHILRNGTTKDPFVMQHLRELFWIASVYNFDICPVHLRGADNLLADTISRLHEKGKFTQLQSLLWLYFRSHISIWDLRYHLSYSAISFLIFQILDWWPWKGNWIQI